MVEKPPVLFFFSLFSCATDPKPSCGVRGMKAQRILKLREEDLPFDQKSCGPSSVEQTPNAFCPFCPPIAVLGHTCSCGKCIEEQAK